MNVNDFLEQVTDNRIVINSVGAIASGKSTYLTGLHNALKYGNPGFKIRRGRFQGPVKSWNDAELLERESRGLERLNATDDPDLFTIYGFNGEIFPIEFWAPGGHEVVKKLDKPEDGLVYILDLNFLNKANNILSGNYRTTKFEDRFIHISGELNDDEIKWELARKYSSSSRIMPTDSGSVTYDIPAFGLHFKLAEQTGVFFSCKPYDDQDTNLEILTYKAEVMGSVLFSVARSMMYAIKRSAEVPTIIVATHGNVIQTSDADILAQYQDNMSRLLSSYQEYINLYTSGFQLPQVNFDDVNIGELFRVDSLSRDVVHRRKLIESAFVVSRNALAKKGIDTANFKLVTFSRAKSNYTIYYKDALL